MQEHRREVLREASIALQGRVVTLWEVSSRAEVIPVMTTAPTSQSGDTRLDLDSTLHRWGSPIIQGSRWVGCRLDDAGAWCVAPVRKQPAGPLGAVRRRAGGTVVRGAGTAARQQAQCSAPGRGLSERRLSPG